MIQTKPYSSTGDQIPQDDVIRDATLLLEGFVSILGIPQRGVSKGRGKDSHRSLAKLLQSSSSKCTVIVPSLRILAHQQQGLKHYKSKNSASEREHQHLHDELNTIFTAHPLYLSKTTIDAAPSLLQNSISNAFCSAIESRLRDWIYMLRRFLIAKQVEKKLEKNSSRSKNQQYGGNATCKEAKVLRALHSVAFSIQIIKVKTNFNTDVGPSSSQEGKEKKRKVISVKKSENSPRQYPVVVDVDKNMDASVRLPLLFEAEVTLKIMGQKNTVLLRTPASAVGTIGKSSSAKQRLLEKLEIQLDAEELRKSMQQQARLVVRQAVTIKMLPLAVNSNIKDKAIKSSTSMRERPITPTLQESSGKDEEIATSTITATGSKILSMPPPPPRTPLPPLVSPTLSECNKTIDSIGIIPVPMMKNNLVSRQVSGGVLYNAVTGESNTDNVNKGIKPNETPNHPCRVSPTATVVTKKRKLASIPDLRL